MKKRAMKKWIPKGIYCHGNDTKKSPYCKWHKFLGIKTLTKDNCKFSNECKQCKNCKISIYKCEYLNYIDYQQETLLFDQCKICDIKEF